MISIKVRVIPKSGFQSIKIEETQWKVRLKSLPEDGKANKELVRILAKFLKIAQSNITIIRGSASKNKTVEIKGISSEELVEKLKTAV